MLAHGTHDRINEWFDLVPRIDLLLVIGTSGQLHGHIIQDARDKGALVVHFDEIERASLVQPEDWFIRGDAAQTLPRLVDMALAS
jgi:NAD-dependent SIR2 family protein deacetylase